MSSSFAVSVTSGVRGWFAVAISRNNEGFWEPEESSPHSYATREEAEGEAKDWAASEGVEFIA